MMQDYYQGSWLSLGITLAAMIFMQGCIARFSGYIPSGPGMVERRYCAAGVQDGFRRQIDSGVEVLLRAGENERLQTIRLDADLMVPEGATVQLLSPDFIFQSDEWKSPHVLSVCEITTPGPKHYKPTEVLNGAIGSLGRYSFWFIKDQSGETGLPQVRSFTLQLPPLLVNGKKFQLTSIKFDAYMKWGVYMCAQ